MFLTHTPDNFARSHEFVLVWGAKPESRVYGKSDMYTYRIFTDKNLNFLSSFLVGSVCVFAQYHNKVSGIYI